MIEIVVRILLAAVLGGAALAKLGSPRSSEAALATFGFAEGPLRRVAWAALIALELGLAVGVALGADGAAYGAAALMAMFAALMVSALLRGRAGAPCACFGSRSRVSWWSVARNLALAVGFAAVPALPDDSLSTDQWLGLGLAVALIAIAGLAIAVLALTREVGMLRLQAATQGALEIAGEGPDLGAVAAPLSERIPRQENQLALAVFTSEGCHLCRTLEPAIESLAAEPRLAVATFDEHAEEELWRELGVPGSPFAIALDTGGAVLAKGTFNNLAQLESVVATAERRRSESELRVFQGLPHA
jgi:hypothetical protein